MEVQTLKRVQFLVLMVLALFFGMDTSSASDTTSISDKGGIFNVDNKRQPLVINSDHLEGDNKKKFVRFSGNVVVERGDITIRSDITTIVYDEASNSVKEIIAEGNVRISQGDRVATGGKAVFISSEDKIILTGNPRVWEGNSIIKGGKIILFLAEDRGVVEADEHTRVNATIYLEKGMKEKGTR